MPIELYIPNKAARKALSLLEPHSDNADIAELCIEMRARLDAVRPTAPWRKVADFTHRPGGTGYETLECGHTYHLKHGASMGSMVQERAAKRRCKQCTP